ncbi:MAG TPA: peptide deformylase, partial [Thermoanaerobaculia bacterium]
FVYEFGGSPERGEPPVPLHALFNPKVTPLSEEKAFDWEGCLSIPDLRGLVPRHTEVRIEALDRDGRPLDYVARGYEARIVQHELDHLDGIVFLDRMQGLGSLAYLDEWERFVLGPSREEDEEAAG